MKTHSYSLAPFIPNSENKWDSRKVRHLHNRISFGVSNDKLKQALKKKPSDYIDELINEAKQAPKTNEPNWASLNRSDYDSVGLGGVGNFFFIRESRHTFIEELLKNPVRGRITLFWHNILVTNIDNYSFAGYAFRYFQVLQNNCLGNYKDFIHKMGKSEAMLKYLNGFENKAGKANENYARELYELFTIGEGHGYTENDIKETARALTGFNHLTKGWGSRIIFKKSTFDAGEKTIFKQTGNWGYDDVNRILFEKKSEQIAINICKKIYKYFVNDNINTQTKNDIIIPLSKTFTDNDFQIAPVLKQLFKSEHFFSENIKTNIIKSPYDLTLGFIKNTGFNFGDQKKLIQNLDFYNSNLGQQIMYPPVVAGWKMDKTWINSGTYSLRQKIMRELSHFSFSKDKESFRQFAIDLSENSKNPEIVVESIFNALMLEKPYSENDFKNAVDTFKSRVPENYFENNVWSLSMRIVPYQVYDLIEFIIKLPDFQLK